MTAAYRQKTIQMCDHCGEEPAEVLHRSRAGNSFEQYEALCKVCASRDEDEECGDCGDCSCQGD